MFIDSSLARGLAKKHLNEWSAQGLLLRKKFDQIANDARLRLRNGASPSKSINRTLRELRQLFAQFPGAGSIVETHGRKSEFSLICPTSRHEGLAFSILEGNLDGRTGGIDVRVTHPLVITIHALERLHQRIGVLESNGVLSEIYAVLSASATFMRAGGQVGATCWPLLGARGIFVTAPTSDNNTSALVTWMPFDQLSWKWGAVAENLREVARNRPELLLNQEFLVEFLRSYLWMQKPHQPGIDIEAIAWGQASAKGNSPTDQSIPSISEKDLAAIEEDLFLPKNLEHQAPMGFEIEDLQRETVYLSNLPTFKVHDRFVGIVIRFTRSGHAVVSLLNGWFGAIPPIGLARANSLVDGIGNISVGDKISVEVRKINRSETGSHLGVFLDLAEKVDVERSLVEANYPKGSVVEGVVVRILDHEYWLRVAAGVSALLIEKELSWSTPLNHETDIPKLGQALTVKVMNTDRSGKVLIVSRRRLTENPFDRAEITEADWQRILVSYPEGTIVQGQINFVLEWGAIIQLFDGTIGFLPVKEFSWINVEADARKATLSRDKSLTLKVIGFKASTRQLTLSHRQCIPHPWDDQNLRPVVGQEYEGVVSNVTDYGAFVRLPSGLEGLLHKSVLPDGWKFETKQAVNVTVASIDNERRRMALVMAVQRARMGDMQQNL